MRKLLTLCALLISFASFSQYNELRYRERVFPSSDAQLNVQYGAAPQWVFPYWNEDLKMDVYRPTGDIHTKRPLIIFAHAGGFLNGAKDVDDMVALCDSFTRKGYVTASIAYRKGFNPLGTGSAERAVYRGIQDGKAAIRYFKEYATTYGIDTNNIFFGGMSAGGYIALHVGYMDKESERPQSTFGGGTVNNLGCLDCSGNTYAHSSKVKGILDYWGAVQDTTIIESGDVPVMIMHGENDPTVPFNYGHPFGLPTLPQTYGGLPVSIRAANLGMDYEFYTSTGPLHMLDGSDNGTFVNGPNAFWSDTLLPRTRDFLLRLIQPNPAKISPDTLRLCYGEMANFEVTNSIGAYYKWTYDVSQINAATNNNSALLQLDYNQAGSFDVAVVEFNELLCASDTLFFHVIVAPEVVADFTTSIANLNEVTFNNTSTGGNSYTWNFGDGNTAITQNATHTYTANGTYQVKLYVVNAMGCRDSIVKTVVIENLSVSEQSLNDHVSLFPNPVEEVLYVANHSDATLIFHVTDVNGKIVMDATPVTANSTYEIITLNWMKGIYFVSVVAENGTMKTLKIVK